MNSLQWIPPHPGRRRPRRRADQTVLAATSECLEQKLCLSTLVEHAVAFDPLITTVQQPLSNSDEALLTKTLTYESTLAAALTDQLTEVWTTSSWTWNADDYASSSLLVQLDPVADWSAVESTLPGSEWTTTGEVFPGLMRVQLDEGIAIDEALSLLNADPRVITAEPDYRIQLTGSPDLNDEYFSSLWGLNNVGQTGGTVDADIDAIDAWSITTGSSSIIVAVIDSGVDYTHPDLAANIWVNPGEIADNGIDDDRNGYVDDVYGYDFFNDDADPMDDNGHGTHVAGTIGAVGGNEIGVVGVNWNVQIMALKFLNDEGSGYVGDAIEALNYAVANGARISNNSWGSSGYSSSLSRAISNARDAGHIVVTAAGNNGANLDNAPHYPASYGWDNIVSVVASDHNDRRASFSNYSTDLADLAAPGVSIRSTLPGGTYGNYSGTSMATPHVTGVLALVMSEHPDWSYQQIIGQVYQTVDTPTLLRGTSLTAGRINAAAAVGPTAPKFDDHADGPTEATPIVIGDDLDGRLEFGNDEDWFAFEGVAGATYQIETMLDSLPDSVLRIYDSNGQTMVAYNDDGGEDLASKIKYSPLRSGTYYIQVTAYQEKLGGSYQLALTESAPPPGIRFLGSVLEVVGDSGDDTIEIEQGTLLKVNYNGTPYYFPASIIDQVIVHGGDGDDRLVIQGTAAQERAEINAGELAYVTADWTLQAQSFEQTVIHSAGGNDELLWADSAGDDRLLATPYYIETQNATGFFQLYGYSQLQATASRGGNNTARLHDSLGDDILAMDQAGTRFSGDGFQFLFTGFDSLEAYSAVGGTDKVTFHDTAGNDRFIAGPGSSRLIAGSQEWAAMGFDEVLALSYRGGRDTAEIYDSVADDVVYSGPSSTELRGVINIKALWFDVVNVSAVQGGNDVAHLYDSTGNDTFIGTPTIGRMLGDGFSNTVRHFPTVYASVVQGGNDTARLEDSVGDVVFVGTPLQSRMLGDGFLNVARGFTVVTAVAGKGGNDTAYLHDSPGDDQFVGQTKTSRMSGEGYSLVAEGFGITRAFAFGGGVNVAELYDSTGDDTLIAGATVTRMLSSASEQYVYNFSSVNAYSRHGNDVASLYDSANVDRFVSHLEECEFSGIGFQNRVSGFSRTYVYSVHGGSDTADFHELSLEGVQTAQEDSTSVIRSQRQERVFHFASVTVHATEGTFSQAEISNLDAAFEQFNG